MEADSNKFTARFIIVVLFFHHVSPSSSASSQPERKASLSSVKGIFRNRRQVCVDGSYEHEGRTCCLCAAGQRLKEHCTTNQDYGKCEHCARGTYNSQPNNQETCVPCTSCSQPNANLEVAEQCTTARDTKCRCKKDHYCSSGTGSCKICHPCTECSAGFKEACTATSDTVCNDSNASDRTPLVAGVVGGLFGLAALGLAVFLIKRCREQRQQDPAQINGKGPDVEMQPLRVPDVDLQSLLPDIADLLGWKDMQNLAMRSGMTDAVIESCKLDHQGDSQEQTLLLLKRWVEKHGKDASRNLIQELRNSGKKAKAEKVLEILSRGTSDTRNTPT